MRREKHLSYVVVMGALFAFLALALAFGGSGCTIALPKDAIMSALPAAQDPEVQALLEAQIDAANEKLAEVQAPIWDKAAAALSAQADKLGVTAEKLEAASQTAQGGAQMLPAPYSTIGGLVGVAIGVIAMGLRWAKGRQAAVLQRAVSTLAGTIERANDPVLKKAAVADQIGAGREVKNEVELAVGK